MHIQIYTSVALLKINKFKYKGRYSSQFTIVSFFINVQNPRIYVQNNKYSNFSPVPYSMHVIESGQQGKVTN